ncbi:MAG: D-tyrosyl-tRNA(Tyr) deacylase [Methanotrichaceae archaeon]|nr:D-tyrosyl-tRNA(Tyr) deacylase [Methanotrichaceae archaeon]
MNNEVAVVCSRVDPASLNIAEHLLALVEWDSLEEYWSYANFRLIIHEEKQITLKSIDKRFVSIGLHPSMIIFASKHKSQSEVPWLGGHFTGEFENGKINLSTAAPAGLKSFLQNISVKAPDGYRISAEATHHGPTDVETPCFFAEIGSCERQWCDPEAAEVVSRAILALHNRELPTFLGFGGGHYMQRQTSLMLDTDIAFGHLFSNYRVNEISHELVKKARVKSGADYAYIDRKSFKAEERDKVIAIIDEIGMPVLRSKEIRKRFPLSMKT